MFYKINSLTLKLQDSNAIVCRKGRPNRRWKNAMTGYVNGCVMLKNSSSKIIRTIPSTFKPQVILQCIVCGGLNCRIKINLKTKMQNLDPGCYTLEDINTILKTGNALKTETRVMGQIERMFKHSDVLLETCCTYPIESELIANLDRISVNLMDGFQPISVKDLEISAEEVSVKNLKLLKKMDHLCTHKVEPCFDQTEGLSEYSDVIWVISNIILLEIDLFPIDDDLPHHNLIYQKVQRYLLNHDGDNVTLILSYDTQKSGHALIASWEIGSHEAYIMDTGAPQNKDYETKTLTPDMKNKIEMALMLLGIEEIHYGTDGLGKGVVAQEGFTCAATCLTISLLIGAGATKIPKISEFFVRSMVCKIRELADRSEIPTIPIINGNDFNTFLTAFLQL
jgi:hypothetical protein